MNRAGLTIAVILSLLTVLVFGLYPELDLKISSQFYDTVAKEFPHSQNFILQFPRYGAMVIAWAFAVPSIVAIIVKLTWPNRPMFMSGSKAVFLVVTMLLCAGVLTNFTSKTYWGRPRPISVTEFNGNFKFKPFWDPRGDCVRNCSFFSGEGATAFWTYAPASLAPPQWRPLAYAGATVFGVVTSGLRVMYGGHFVTDVLIAGLITFLTIWLFHALIFRWPRTALTDQRVDAVLTRIGWPGYAWRQRLLGAGNPPKPWLADKPAEASKNRVDETGARPHEV